MPKIYFKRIKSSKLKMNELDKKQQGIYLYFCFALYISKYFNMRKMVKILSI